MYMSLMVQIYDEIFTWDFSIMRQKSQQQLNVINRNSRERCNFSKYIPKKNIEE